MKGYIQKMYYFSVLLVLLGFFGPAQTRAQSQKMDAKNTPAKALQQKKSQKPKVKAAKSMTQSTATKAKMSSGTSATTLSQN